MDILILFLLFLLLKHLLFRIYILLKEENIIIINLYIKEVYKILIVFLKQLQLGKYIEDNQDINQILCK